MVTGRLMTMDEALRARPRHRRLGRCEARGPHVSRRGRRIRAQFTPPHKASMAVGRIKRAVQSGAEAGFGEGLALERELQQLPVREPRRQGRHRRESGEAEADVYWRLTRPDERGPGPDWRQPGLTRWTARSVTLTQRQTRDTARKEATAHWRRVARRGRRRDDAGHQSGDRRSHRRGGVGRRGGCRCRGRGGARGAQRAVEQAVGARAGPPRVEARRAADGADRRGRAPRDAAQRQADHRVAAHRDSDGRRVPAVLRRAGRTRFRAKPCP